MMLLIKEKRKKIIIISMLAISITVLSYFIYRRQRRPVNGESERCESINISILTKQE